MKTDENKIAIGNKVPDMSKSAIAVGMAAGYQLPASKPMNETKQSEFTAKAEKEQLNRKKFIKQSIKESQILYPESIVDRIEHDRGQQMQGFIKGAQWAFEQLTKK
jgi:hypothetical protein